MPCPLASLLLCWYVARSTSDRRKTGYAKSPLKPKTTKARCWPSQHMTPGSDIMVCTPAGCCKQVNGFNTNKVIVTISVERTIPHVFKNPSSVTCLRLKATRSTNNTAAKALAKPGKTSNLMQKLISGSSLPAAQDTLTTSVSKLSRAMTASMPFKG